MITREELLQKLANDPKWDVGVAINRTNPVPTDATAVLESVEALTAYATSNPIAYPGQIVAVLGETEVAAYLIKTVGENASISKLAASSVSGDISADVETLKTQVANIINGTQVVGEATKATQDGEGNVISTTYATAAALEGVRTTAEKGVSDAAVAKEAADAAKAVADEKVGAVSLASGAANGTVKLTVDGVESEVAVKGLGSAAYTNSSAYAAASHTHSQYLTAHQPIYALTIQKNGTTAGTYTPNSQAATINISDIASAATLSAHTTNTTVHITANERTLWNKITGLFDVDTDGDVYVKNGKGFYTEGFISAGAKGTSGGSGSTYTQKEWAQIKDMTATVAGSLGSAYAVKEAYSEAKTLIDANTGNITSLTSRVTTLEGKATAVSFSQTLTSGTKIGAITVDGTTTNIYAPTPPTNVSQLTNDSGYITGITKSMVEGVLTGNITSHTHSYIPLADKGLSNGKVPYYVNFPDFKRFLIIDSGAEP